MKDETDKNVEVISRRGADWLNVSKDRKIFRKLTFHKPEGFAKARLYFKDNKLAIIELEAKYTFEEGWIDPDNLTEILALDFKPYDAFRGDKLPPPGEFAASGDPSTKDKLGFYYEMIAVTQNSFVFAGVENRYPVSVLGGNPSANAKKQRDKGGKYPGNVTKLQIISRRFEKETTM